MTKRSRQILLGLASIILSLLVVETASCTEAFAKIRRPIRDSLKRYEFALGQGEFYYAALDLKTIINSFVCNEQKPDESTFPSLCKLNKMLVDTLELAGHLPEAVEHCSYVISNISKFAEPAETKECQLQALSTRAWANVMEGNSKKAFEDLDLIKANPVFKSRVGLSFENTEERITEAAAYTLAGQYDHARKMIDGVLSQFVNYSNESDRIYSRAFLWRARLNLACGNTDAALADAAKSGDIAGTSWAARLARARALTEKSRIELKRGKLNLSIKAVEDALRELKNLPEAYVQLAEAQRLSGNISEAEDALTRATTLFGNRPQIDLAKSALLKESARRNSLSSTSSTASSVPIPSTSTKPNESPDKPAAIRDKWALVVGVSKFLDPSLNLKFAAKDAGDFANFLVKEANFAPDHVRLLIDGESTREKILENLADKWLPHAVKPGDLVVLYISTHASPDTKEYSELNYLFAYDTKPDVVQAGGIAFQDLIRILRTRIHTNRIVLILDACHSGAAQAKSLVRSDDSLVTRLSLDTNATVIASSQGEERSWELLNQQNSAFTYYLLQGLRLKGEKTTLKEAFEHMKSRVSETVIKERGLIQTPVMADSQSDAHLALGARPEN